MINNEQLLESYRQGLIPFEAETEELYLKRVSYCLDSKDLISKNLNKNDEGKSFKIESLPEKLLVGAQNFYGISPTWIPLLVSNEKFLPWQGAATWIVQLESNDPMTAIIQVPEKVSTILGSTEELVTHEVAHIGRMGFEEKQFEEMLAYRSSPKRWRRYWGPLFQSSSETILFVSLFALVVVFDFGLLFSGSVGWYDRFMWLKIMPFAYFSYLVFRLVRNQKIFKKTLSHLPLPLTYLLLDEEIVRFSKSSTEEIKEYIQDGKKLSLRRRLLELVYNG